MSGSANAELLSATLRASVSSSHKQIFLVSRSGDRIGVNAEVAKASSEYFSGALDAGMTEAGK